MTPSTGDPDPGRDVLDRISHDLASITQTTARVLADLADASARGLAERLAGLPLDTLIAVSVRLPAWEARRVVGVAELLADLPWLAAQVDHGDVAWSTLAALSQHVRRLDAETRRWVDQTLADNPEVLEDPEGLVDAVAALVDRARPRAAENRERRGHDATFVAVQPSFDGGIRLFGDLDPLSAAPIVTALDHAARHTTPTPDSDTDDRGDRDADATGDGGTCGRGAGGAGDPVTGKGRSLGRRRADGLVTLATSWLNGHRTPCQAHSVEDAVGDAHSHADRHAGHPGHAGHLGHAGHAGGGHSPASPAAGPFTAGDAAAAEDNAAAAGHGGDTDGGGAGHESCCDRPVCSTPVAPAVPSLLVATDIANLIAATSGQSTGDDLCGRVAVAAQLLLAGDAPVALTPTALGLLACDATLTPVLTDGTKVLGVAAPTATIPDDVRAALVVRDRGCRFPGCHRAAPACHAHHITFREHGGHTVMENLVLLCDRHHRLVHYRGWRLHLDDDATLTATFHRTSYTTRPRTTGPVMTTAPPPTKRRRRRRTAATQHRHRPDRPDRPSGPTGRDDGPPDGPCTTPADVPF